MAQACWNGTARTFTVDLDVNVRDTFGPAAFLVDNASQKVVSLSATGQPTALLDASATYSIFSGSSQALKKSAQALQGKLHAVRNDMLKLRERHAKLAACFEAELAHLRALVSSSTSTDVAASTAAAAATMRTAWAAAHPETDDELIGPTAAVAIGAAASTAAPAPSHASAAAGASAGAASAGAASATASTPLPAAPFSAAPIGELRTCFVEKNGTPRQGCVCPSSAATLRLRLGNGLNAAHSLEGLSHFSHVWLIFVFDKNGNAAAKSKIHPPRLDGAKVGLFATRTPHRPNPIGLSLVELEAVKGDTLHLKGIDLVDRTPVLDVKPYVPFADGNRLPAPTVAPWLEQMPTPDLRVEFTPEADAQLSALAPSLLLLGNAARARSALAEILAADPRSVHWRQHRTDLEYGFSVDCLNVVVRFTEGVATVIQVQHLDFCDRSHTGS